MALALATSTVACRTEIYQATTNQPPPVMREFRATWIPTVGNSCWPSKQGLTTAQQQAELLALLDRAKELNLNAVIFQVRPACDALYKSDLEPWSEYLTGTQGKAPSPYYDPLEFAITEAHQRGLELHAWFNPYRARHQNAKSPVAASHITRTRPDLTRRYNLYQWLDPGERDVQDHSLRVVLDVLKRYDVDGIHFDDYFYPYPEKNSAGREIDFPDDASWQKTGASSGLSRDDWRRRNVDQFLQRTYQAIHAAKPQVKFGLSPFGIWRPKHPPVIQGLDAYDKLYADARKWLREGWCDYLAPQLYWAIDQAPQSFPVLLKWWDSENLKKRHVWPGLNTLKVGSGWDASEIKNQIAITRKDSTAPGQVHWSASALMKNASVQTMLSRDSYRQPALIPKFGWMLATTPAKPSAVVNVQGKVANVRWSAKGTNAPALWVVQWKEFGDWRTAILGGGKTSHQFDLKPDVVAVTGVDRCGNTSPPAVVNLVK